MKPEEFKEELKPSTRAIIVAGPARPHEADLSYVPFPDIREIIRNFPIFPKLPRTSRINR